MKHHVEPRPQTESREVIRDLLYVIRNQMYREDQQKYFWGQMRDLQRAITWPATWFNGKAIFVPADRYKAILLDRLMEIKRHGDTAGVQYWPRYILTCLQHHFGAEGERYYNEGKAARDLVSRIVSKLPTEPAAPDTFTRELAAAHALLRSPGGRKKGVNPAAPAAVQKELFG